MGIALIVVPLVALLLPIVLLIAALIIDAVYMSSVAYQVWHERAHGRLWRLLHRSA